MALTSVFIQAGALRFGFPTLLPAHSSSLNWDDAECRGLHQGNRFTLRRKYSVSLTPVLRTSASYLARLRSLICLPIFPPPLPPLSPTLYK
ncbi:hypothetical protein B0H13DRAFT_2354140 [Mycena leptocephala]|nr:hypothetical protein B0H13DRAFT_2354140 [Mycena leptocephala]